MRSSAAVPWDRFLASAGRPRPVPLRVALRILLGGAVPQAAWLAGAFVSIFLWGFQVPSLVVDLLTPRGEMVDVEVVVAASRETSIELNERRVMRHDVRYVVDGQPRLGVAYTTGPAMLSGPLRARAERHGSIVEVQGMRTTAMPAGALLVALVWLAMGWPVVGAFARNARRLRLLRHGQPARGRLLRVEVLEGSSLRGRRVFHFEFQTARGERVQVAERAVLGTTLQDQREEPVLYDAADPARAVVLGALPGDPQIDEGGDIVMRSALTPMLLLLPGLFVLVNGLGLLLTVAGS